MNELRRTGSDAERAKTFESYRKMHSRYKRDHGLFEYRTLQAFARATRLLPLVSEAA
jgi:hypothetical protein